MLVPYLAIWHEWTGVLPKGLRFKQGQAMMHRWVKGCEDGQRGRHMGQVHNALGQGEMPQKMPGDKWPWAMPRDKIAMLRDKLAMPRKMPGDKWPWAMPRDKCAMPGDKQAMPRQMPRDKWPWAMPRVKSAMPWVKPTMPEDKRAMPRDSTSHIWPRE